MDCRTDMRVHNDNMRSMITTTMKLLQMSFSSVVSCFNKSFIISSYHISFFEKDGGGSIFLELRNKKLVVKRGTERQM